ncbi:sugar kinase [Shimia abyssi]|uniref:2-keto-3-deoxygluconate kinase n=1 Tax=Shimia abyssi TaxID=1662395 RepID=A0A2P8FB07_9RHOB|nr:sugar kinase [Shimia abyssi]PSL18894.1 2-keto-3-deoxygluconate kinase [Shimia abyssi]
MRILAIGECMAELAPNDTPGEFRLGFAGDTFNTAWYLAQCAPDISVSYLTAVGRDSISADLTQFLRESGVNDSFVQTVPDRSIGLYLISLNNGERSFSYWRDQSAARTLADDPVKLRDAMLENDVIYFSGITLAILDTKPREHFFAALREARQLGKIVMFDPNLRPRLWPSESVMTDTIMMGANVADIALPSFEDENSFFGDASPLETAQRYARAGVTTTIVKNGAEPVIFLEGETSGEVNVQPVKELIDSTAAGDSFNAGILAGHVSGSSLPDGIAYACRLSRQVVQQRGALVPIDFSPIAMTQRS